MVTLLLATQQRCRETPLAGRGQAARTRPRTSRPNAWFADRKSTHRSGLRASHCLSSGPMREGIMNLLPRWMRPDATEREQRTADARFQVPQSGQNTHHPPNCSRTKSYGGQGPESRTSRPGAWRWATSTRRSASSAWSHALCCPCSGADMPGPFRRDGGGELHRLCVVRRPAVVKRLPHLGLEPAGGVGAGAAALEATHFRQR